MGSVSPHKGRSQKRKRCPRTDSVIVPDEEADVEQDRDGEGRTEEPYCEPSGSRPRREWPRSDMMADEPQCPRRSAGRCRCEMLRRVLVVRWPGMERDWERERGSSSSLLRSRRRRRADCCCGHSEGSGQGHSPPRCAPLLSLSEASRLVREMDNFEVIEKKREKRVAFNQASE